MRVDHALRAYREALEKELATGMAREHAYRPALKNLLQGLATEITAVNDPRRSACGAPDFVVLRDVDGVQLITGYAEAKDIGTNLDEVERSEQVKDRYLPALPNLILTDYLEFRWYVNGARQRVARLGAVSTDGRVKPDPLGEAQVGKLLADFLQREPEPIASAPELARRMARITHLTRDVILTALKGGQASSILRDLKVAFEKTLIPDLTDDAFADMYAQTLTYGLFAARCNHEGRPETFRRIGAAAEIPKTNPFLRELFDMVTGVQLNDEPYAGLVDDLTQTLAWAHMDLILEDFGKRKGREDPVLHFYETFLAAYDPKERERRGVYYTPEPVVSYIVRSVDYLLRERFACAAGLADRTRVPAPDGGEGSHRVLILDPACGTGTFLYAVVDLIRDAFRRAEQSGQWSEYVRKDLLPRLFGFELLMAPYAVAHFKLGMQLGAQDLDAAERSVFGYDFQGSERLGIYLTNTLEEAIRTSELLMARFISDEANRAAEVKRELPIMVVLGNPPYAKHSANRGQWIGRLVRDYYQVAGKPLGERNSKWLQDDYVKFLRFAEWRIGRTGAGVLGFITNHGYLNNPTFRGMREHLLKSFSDIYILNLHGNSNKGERGPDGRPDDNVFDIQPGVAIGLFVRTQGESGHPRVRYADVWGTREAKNAWLIGNTLETTHWQDIRPEAPHFLFIPHDVKLLPEYQAGYSVTRIFCEYTSGITTGRNGLFLDLSREALEARVAALRDATQPTIEAADRYGMSYSDLERVRSRLRGDGDRRSRAKLVAYRPFDLRWLYYWPEVLERPRVETMRHMLRANLALLTHRPQSPQEFTYAFCTRLLADQCAAANKGAGGGNTYLFPLYVYATEASENSGQRELSGVAGSSVGGDVRCPNLEPGFVTDVESRLCLRFGEDARGDLESCFGAEEIFAYIYAILHAPSYRSRYAEFLKIDFPRIPLTSSQELFQGLVEKGRELVALHLLEDPRFAACENPLTQPLKFPVGGENAVEKVSYVGPGEKAPDREEPLGPHEGRGYISQDRLKQKNPGQFFQGVSPEVWEFHIGGYQVCEKWLKDRKGRKLSAEDIAHYNKIVVALRETIRLMGEVDEVIEAHGGWPMK